MIRRPAQSHAFSWSGMLRAFSLLELLVALAVAMTFLTAVYMSFIQVLRSSDRTEARVEALRNGRTALMTMVEEIKSIDSAGSVTLLVLANGEGEDGDGLDNDRDGSIDEESLDGLDNDGDYSALTDDQHAVIADNVGLPPVTVVERPSQLLVADLGDFDVDEDVVFGTDTLTIMLFPADAGVTSQTITYRLIPSVEDLTTSEQLLFDGPDFTLVKDVVTETTDTATSRTISPLAFQVLGLDFLAYDSDLLTTQPWNTSWDTTTTGTTTLPESVFMRVTLYADPRPFEEYSLGEEVETLLLQTMVNIE